MGGGVVVVDEVLGAGADVVAAGVDGAVLVGDGLGLERVGLGVAAWWTTTGTLVAVVAERCGLACARCGCGVDGGVVCAAGAPATRAPMSTPPVRVPAAALVNASTNVVRRWRPP